jgi:hypothetical protein
MEGNEISNFFFSILCEILYMFGLIKNKFTELIEIFNKNNENNNTTISYIKISDQRVEESKINIDEKFQSEYDFQIINHDKKNILLYNKNQDISEIKEKDCLNYEFLLFCVNYKNTKYEINLKTDNYNFFILNNDIGNPLFIYWYLFSNYNSIELPNFDEFKENNNIWNITLIDQHANLKDNLICNSILLNKNNYIFQ